jgi:hypothetical protein
MGLIAPADYTIERMAVTTASPQTVHHLVDDFHRWVDWSPWEDVDPDLKRTYTGPDAGVGASYAWEGNRKAGAGSMTITESVPAERVVIDLVFTKPFAAKNVTTFLLDSVDGRTRVRWQMRGTRNLLLRIFGTVVSMDKMVGGDFEKGLGRLVTLAERA